MSFPSDKKERLLELAGQQQELFSQMLGLTEKQSSLIRDDKTEEFAASLESREAIINTVKGLHQEYDGLMQSYISSASGAGGKAAQVEAAAAKLRALVSECARLNDANIAAAKEKLAEYSKGSDKIRQSRESIGLYIQGLTNNAEHIDRMT